MADIFLSYAREDQALAERLAAALEDAGKTVWWDRHIKGGAEFSKDIEEQLEAAEHVVVLWSRHSVQSRWVRDEASEAADSHRLISASADGTPPPLGFRQFHSVDLSEWSIEGAALPTALLGAVGAKDNEFEQASAPLDVPPKRKSLLLAAVGAALLLVGVLAIFRPGPIGDWLEATDERDQSTLAILPFSVSGDPELSYLGKGLAITLSDGMSRLQGLTLTSTTSTQAVVDQNLPLNEIGEALGVTHFVEGDIRVSDDRLQVTIRLIDASNEQQVWSNRFDGAKNALSDLERRIGSQLAAAIKARLGLTGGDFKSRANVDPRAYDAYLKGMEQLSVRFELSARNESLRQFRLARQIEPDFAEAWAGEAYLLSLSSSRHFPLSFEEIARQQKVANDRALELAPDNVMAIIARGNAVHNFFGDIEGSYEFTGRALELDPDSGLAHYSLASTHVMAGKPQEALAHYDRAIAADPFNRVLKIYRTLAWFHMGDYQSIRAESLACEAPCNGAAFQLFDALLAFGEPFDLERDFPEVLARLEPEIPPETRAEMRAAARHFILGEQATMSPPGSDAFGFNFAVLLANVGLVDEAFEVANRNLDYQQADEILQLANESRFVFPKAVRADPRYHALFAIPRFKAVAEYRRKRGLTGGLPVFPVRQYERD